jgi:hypothetical protein
VPIAYYLLWFPPKLANDFEEQAKAEHAEVEEALRPATETFNDVTLGTITFERKDPRAYLRTYQRVAARDRREHAAARRRVRSARRTLARIDEEAMTEPPGWPLLSGRGDMAEAHDVAREERAYLRKARAFLRDYDELLAYEQASNRWLDRVNLAFVRSEIQTPEAPTSAAQITGPLNRAVRLATAAARRYRRLKAPRPVQREHRRTAAEVGRFIGRQRAIAAAVARDDYTRVRAIERRDRRENKLDDRRSREDLVRLTERSSYKRQIADLESREIKIFDAYQDL